MKILDILMSVTVVVAVILSVSAPTPSMAASLPAALQSFLATDYTLIATVEGLPMPIQAALFGRMKHDPRLANPGARFNATDVVDPEYPMRRLIVAGHTPTSWFICYENGGRGYHRTLVIMASDAGTPRIVFAGRFTATVRSYTDMRAAIERNLIPDETVETERYGFY